jgi:hypothetical protein
VSPERDPGAAIEAVKLLVRNGMAEHPDVSGTGAAPAAVHPAEPALAGAIADAVSEVISWPAAARRTVARTQAERIPWSAAVEEMVNPHATVPAGDVMSTGKTR